MTIAEEITRIKNCVKNAYVNCQNKGAILPETKNIANLPSTISSINGNTSSKYGLTMNNLLGDVDENGELQEPISGELVANGIVKVDNAILAYKFCNYIEQEHYYDEGIENFTNRNVGFEIISFPDLEYIGNNAMRNFINYAPDLIEVSFPKLEEVGEYGLYYGFYQDNNVQNISFPKLEKIGNCGLQNCFNNSNITNVQFPELVEVYSGGLSGCFSSSNVSSLSIPKLKKAYGNALSHLVYYCKTIESMSFDNLEDIAYQYVFQYTFGYCTKLKNIYFPALKPESFGKYTNQFSYMLTGVSGCTVHFPYCVKDTIQNWSDVTNGFSGTNTTVLFDLKIVYINFETTSENAQFYINGKAIDGVNGYSSPGDSTYIGHETNTNTVIIDNLYDLQDNSTTNVSINFNSQSQKITLSTGVSGLDIIFNVNGVEIPALEESTGNYIIKIIGNIDEISYFINGAENYLDVENVITLTGSNIIQQITMTPATVATFIRPNLTSNGTLGGDSFAVSGTGTVGSNQPYTAMDADTSTNKYWWVSLGSGNFAEFIFYNPKPLKVQSLVISYQSNSTTWQASTIIVQGSNNNEKWIDLSTSAYVSGISRTVTVNSEKFYKYHRLLLKQYSVYLGITDIKVNAKYKE